VNIRKAMSGRENIEYLFNKYISALDRYENDSMCTVQYPISDLKRLHMLLGCELDLLESKIKPVNMVVLNENNIR